MAEPKLLGVADRVHSNVKPSCKRQSVRPSVRPSPGSPGRRAGGQAGRQAGGGTEERQMDDDGAAGSRRRALNYARGHHTPPLSSSLRVSAEWARGEHAVDGRFLTRRGTSSRRPTSPTDRLVHKTRREMGTRTAGWG